MMTRHGSHLDSFVNSNSIKLEKNKFLGLAQEDTVEVWEAAQSSAAWE